MILGIAIFSFLVGLRDKLLTPKELRVWLMESLEDLFGVCTVTKAKCILLKVSYHVFMVTYLEPADDNEASKFVYGPLAWDFSPPCLQDLDNGRIRWAVRESNLCSTERWWVVLGIVMFSKNLTKECTWLQVCTVFSHSYKGRKAPDHHHEPPPVYVATSE